MTSFPDFLADFIAPPIWRPQPTSNDCFVCGRHNPRGLQMTFYDNGADEVRALYTINSQFQGYPGVVHGGIVATILDEAVGRVALIEDHHHFMFTLIMEVKYRHPTPPDTPLRISGKIVRLRSHLGKAVGTITLPNGDIAAETSVTLAEIPPELLRFDADQLGWRLPQ
ncbi:MAG TPA: PaaI family thioesterase [Anaerolineae bacterium]|nr:PaaI family thioesterase [Anaerolineae bacterium]